MRSSPLPTMSATRPITVGRWSDPAWTMAAMSSQSLGRSKSDLSTARSSAHTKGSNCAAKGRSTLLAADQPSSRRGPAHRQRRGSRRPPQTLGGGPAPSPRAPAPSASPVQSRRKVRNGGNPRSRTGGGGRASTSSRRSTSTAPRSSGGTPLEPSPGSRAHCGCTKLTLALGVRWMTCWSLSAGGPGAGRLLLPNLARRSIPAPL